MNILLIFEKVADSLNWPKDSWVLLLLQSVLLDKAQEIYGFLSVEQISNSEHVRRQYSKLTS